MPVAVLGLPPDKLCGMLASGKLNALEKTIRRSDLLRVSACCLNLRK
jgi:hypothetical protein